MDPIIAKNITTIHKYISPYSMRCPICVCNDMSDGYCSDCDDGYCDVPRHQSCYRCYIGSNPIGRIIIKIIKIAFIKHGTPAYLELNTLLNAGLIPRILDTLLVKCIEYPDRIDELVKLGANVDLDYGQYNPNFTLLEWCMYNHEYETAKRLCLYSNGDIFIHTNRCGMNTLESFVSSYISCRVYDMGDIKLLMSMGAEVSDIYLEKLGISGCEYGDKSYTGCNHHEWRRRRIKDLIRIGVNYHLKNMRGTRLGHYLNYLEVLKCI